MIHLNVILVPIADEAGPVTSSPRFVVASWVFLLSLGCSHIVLVISCLFLLPTEQRPGLVVD